MGKYTPLAEFLKSQPKDSVELVFADIERHIAEKLFPSAHKSFRFWDNEQGNSSLYTCLYNVGFEVVMVDFENENVRFKRK